VVAGNELVAMGVALFAFVADRPWHSAFLSLYDGGGLVLSWLKRKYLFESSLTPPQSLSALLTVPKPTYVAVRDVATASPWYVEKFGLRKLSSAEQLQPDGIALQFDASSNPVILLPKDPTVFRSAPVFFTRKVDKVRARLIARGICADLVQQDGQGTNYFELLDGEGNAIEVSEEP
jgi:hypothetical protein